MTVDRLGSVVGNPVSVSGSSPLKYYLPYGEQVNGTQSPATFPGNTNFATYFKDQSTGLDYADQRFYNSAHGFSRFMTADPYRRSAKAMYSASWNKYSYSGGDPINRRDSKGLYYEDWPWTCDATESDCDDDDSGTGVGRLGGRQQEAQPRCWLDLGAVYTTLSDLGTNISFIAREGIESEDLGREITQLNSLISSTVLKELEGTAAENAMNGAGPYYNGGHFNLYLDTPALRNIFGLDFNIFNQLFGGTGDGTRQDAVFGDPATSGYTLHSKVNNNTFEFHFDIYNPLNGPISLFKHFFVEVVGGHAASPCLDPAFTR